VKTLTLHAPRLESTSTLWIGREILSRARELFELEHASTVSMVADSSVSQIRESLQKELHLTDDRVLTIPGGESCKTTGQLIDLWRFFAEQKLDRRSLVIAVGGGSVTDVVGFAAATYMRGIDFIHVPTTLLAQVDASIGGKTGINFNDTKNLLGAVNQPRGVLIDSDVLAHLPTRQLCSGFAEILKHGLIADSAYLTLATQKPCTQFSPDELVAIILRSCEIKRSIVEADESETGLRKTLNFGHTIGHAVESLSLQTAAPLTHGEAVAIGMYGEAVISHLTGRISAADIELIAHSITRVGLPTNLSSTIADTTIMEIMARDKKNARGTIKWTLLNRIGEATFDIEVPEGVVRKALHAIQPQ
jgi:3-dehydroquinate synthase